MRLQSAFIIQLHLNVNFTSLMFIFGSPYVRPPFQSSKCFLKLGLKVFISLPSHSTALSFFFLSLLAKS